MIRLLLVDDEADMLLLLTARFDLEPDLEVVGTAKSGEQAIAQAHALLPDLVVMDLAMPDTDGYEAIRRLRDELPEVAIVAFSAVVSEFARRQMALHHVPLVLKQGDSAPLVRVIRSEAAAYG